MHPPRIPFFSYQGLHRYFLTLCTAERSLLFTADGIVFRVLAQFRESASQQQFAIIAFCFMPEHLHLLCASLSDSADLRRFVTEAKQKSGYRFGRSVGGRLWQPGFYDHVLRDDEQTLAVVRYILANPIRAGLARVLGEYPFCGSDVFSIEEIGECLQAWTPSARGTTTVRQP
jgi:putative transposase